MMHEKHEEQDPFMKTEVYKCYQCGKCTAGCPVAGSMDISPNQMMRLIQIGAIDKAIRCMGIWCCVSCQTCSTRCPQGVDIAGAIDQLREQSAAQNAIAPELSRVVTFQKAFLDNIRRYGRVNEVELIGQFKTRAFMKDLSVPLLMKDALLAPKLMQRGKFHLTGEKVRDRALVRRIFDRCLGDTSTKESN